MKKAQLAFLAKFPGVNEWVEQDTEIWGKIYFGASNSQISLCVELTKTEQMAKEDYWQL